MRTREENKILQKEDLTFLSETVKAYPMNYYIAVSVVCDIRCPFCPRQFYKDVVRQNSGLMDYEKFLNFAPYLKYADYAGFFGLGEPFLNKKFFNFISEAKKYGAYAATSTHGLSLTTEVCEKIIDVSLDEIAVSFDSPKKNTFEFLRKGADFAVVKRNVKYLTSLKKQKNSDKPAIHIAAAVSKYNIKHISDMISFAKDIGGSRIVFTNLIIVDEKNESLSVAGTPEFKDKIEKAKKQGEKIGIEVLHFPQNPFPYKKQERTFSGKERFGCYEAWRTFAVERNGMVRPCCYLEADFGNAFEQSIDEIMNNESFRKLRRSFIDKNLNPTCRSCENLQIITD